MDVKLRLKSFIASEIFATFRGTCKPKLFLSNSRKLLGCLGFVIILGSTVSGFTGVTTFSEQKEATLGLPGSLSPDANYEKPSIEKLDGNRVHIYFGTPPPYARTPGGNDRIQLVNSKNAADPTWEQLKLFLLLDKTDQKDYDSLSYPCGAYAEEVHNNAEAAGIKAAWIAVEFEGDSIRHALNGFRTTDRGLVWIDCTNLWPTNCARDGVYSQDKVAYLVVGEEYGLINLNVAPGFDYAAYEEYVQKRLDCESLSKVYYQKAREYMVEIQQYDERSSLPMGQVSPGDPDRGQEWNEQLEMEKAGLDVLGENVERLRESLGPFWSTLGMVTSVEIYW